MILAGFAAHEFAASGDPEGFAYSFVSLLFRHVISLGPGGVIPSAPFFSLALRSLWAPRA